MTPDADARLARFRAESQRRWDREVADAAGRISEDARLREQAQRLRIWLALRHEGPMAMMAWKRWASWRGRDLE